MTIPTCCEFHGVDCDEGRTCPRRAEGWPTVRRHPRSLADAFPDVRAQFIEPPEPRPLLSLRLAAPLVLTALALRIVAAVAARRFLNLDLVATYLRHRRMFFSRRASLLRALYVSLPFFSSKAKQ